MKGHGNIYSGYDQLLAFFNNKTWRRDLPYGRRGWGPRGGRKYKNGTGTSGHAGGNAILGDGGKTEPFMLPDGRIGLSPAIATLFPNLPKGTVVWKSIQDFMNEQAPEMLKNLWSQVSGSLNVFEPLQQQISQTITGGSLNVPEFNVRESAGHNNILDLFKTNSTNNQGNSVPQPIQLVLKPADVYIDGEKIGEIAFDYVEDQQAINHSIRKTFGGK